MLHYMAYCVLKYMGGYHVNCLVSCALWEMLHVLFKAEEGEEGGCPTVLL